MSNVRLLLEKHWIIFRIKKTIIEYVDGQYIYIHFKVQSLRFTI